MIPHGLAARLPSMTIGGIARSVMLVGSAAAFGQGALILASPLLARLYSPEAFGLLSVYSAALVVLLSISSLRFDLAIPIAEDASEALHLLLLSVAIAFGSCLVLGAILFLWGPSLAALAGASSVVPILWTLPVALGVVSVAQGLASWAIYHRTFSALGRMRAMQGLAQAVAQAVLGVLRAGPGGLIVGDVVGRVVGVEQLLRPFVRAAREAHIGADAVRRAARNHWGFARVMTMASFVNALSLQIPFLLIPALFNLDASGQYFLAYRMLVLPASLVGAGVSQVFFGEASHRRDDPQRLHDMALGVAVSLLVFSIPTYTIVLVAGQDLITILFGSQWSQGGIYAQVMAPGLILWSVASPISTLLLVGRREIESLAFTLAELLLKAAALLLGAAVGSLLVGIAALTVATVLINVGALWRILRVAGASVLDLIRPGLRILAVTLPFALVLLLVHWMPPVVVVVTAFAAWAAALLISARLTPELRALISGSRD